MNIQINKQLILEGVSKLTQHNPILTKRNDNIPVEQTQTGLAVLGVRDKRVGNPNKRFPAQEDKGYTPKNGIRNSIKGE